MRIVLEPATKQLLQVLTLRCGLICVQSGGTSICVSCFGHGLKRRPHTLLPQVQVVDAAVEVPCIVLRPPPRFVHCRRRISRVKAKPQGGRQ